MALTYTTLTGEEQISVILDIVNEYPPKFTNRYKSAVWDRVMDRIDSVQYIFDADKIGVSQYEFNGDLNARVGWHSVKVSQVPQYFDYEASTAGMKQWYLNYADLSLFFGYGGSLFAQDEIQTLEHPMLGGVLEYLRHGHRSVMPFTAMGSKPTPVLVENAPCLVEVDTEPVVDGQKRSIYGNNFIRAMAHHPEVLDAAITLRDEPTYSNIIAMAAPAYGHGEYTTEQIEYMLTCCIAAFEGAKSKSPSKLNIHTGRWGAGAFGGNEELALMVQMFAASLLGIDELTFHAIDSRALTRAQSKMEPFCRANQAPTLASLVAYIHSLRYAWGHSDGN